MSQRPEFPTGIVHTIPTSAAYIAQGRQGTIFLPTLVAFRILPEGCVILHITQSLAQPKTQETYQTRVFWVLPTALGRVQAQIQRYFDPHDSGGWTSKRLLRKTLENIHEIMADPTFQTHWQGTDHQSDRYTLDKNGLYPMTRCPGGQIVPVNDPTVHHQYWQEQKHLTTAIEVASDPANKTKEAYKHWIRTCTSDQYNLGSIFDETQAGQSYTGSSRSSGSTHTTGSQDDFNSSAMRTTITRAGGVVAWNPSEFTPLSFISSNEEKLLV